MIIPYPFTERPSTQPPYCSQVVRHHHLPNGEHAGDLAVVLAQAFRSPCNAIRNVLLLAKPNNLSNETLVIRTTYTT